MQLEEQYLLEKELSNRLRRANKKERRALYKQVYDEFYRLVPGLITPLDSPPVKASVAYQMRLLKQFLGPTLTFVEIGAGTCALSFEVSKYVQKAYAIDVSAQITSHKQATPQNFELIISDGINIAIPANSADVAYSTSLMEHLHPDDALEQLGNICQILKQKGIYICVTPNRLHGPRDISKFFGDKVATGLHLKEYTSGELATLFRKAGFSRVSIYLPAKIFYLRMPLWLMKCYDIFFGLLPSPIRRALSDKLPFRIFGSIIMVGKK